MDTKELECFEAVYAEKSIHQAASKLYITPQGLGRIIRSLEDELQVTLFERSRQGVVATEAGHVLHRRGTEILHQHHRLLEEVFELKTGEKSLRIGLANGVLRAIPLQLILDFCIKNPTVQMEWAEYDNDDIILMLERGDLDYGIVVGDCRNPNLEQRCLRSLPMVLMVYEGHPFYEANSVTLESLRQEKLVTMNEHFRMYQDLIRACAIKGFAPNIIVRTKDGGTLEQLCYQHVGLALLPDFGSGNMRGLRAVPFEEKTTWDVYSVLPNERRTYEVIRLFDDYLRECVESLKG